jgi:hypothetical protein
MAEAEAEAVVVTAVVVAEQLAAVMLEDMLD